MRYFDSQPADDLSAMGRITQDIGDVSGRDPLSALKELEDLLSISVPPLDSLRRCQIAEQWEALGNYPAALQQLAQVDIERVPSDIAAMACLRKASICRWQSDAPQAIHVGKQALAYARDAQDEECMAESLAVVGYAYWMLEENALAYENLKDAYDILIRTNNLKAFAQVCWSLAFVCNLIGKTEEAWTVTERGIHALSSSSKSSSTFAQTLLGHLHACQAVIAFERGQIGRALLTHERALDYWMGTNDPRLLANGYRNLAEVRFATGNWDQAETLLEQVTYLLGDGEPAVRCSTLVTLGRLASRRGRYDEARLKLAEAMILAAQTGAKSLEADCRDALGETAFLNRQFDEAFEHFTVSRELYLKVHHPTKITYGMLRLAETHLERGQLDEARECHRQAENLASQQANRLLQALNDRVGGRIAIARNDAVTGLSLLTRSIAVCESLEFIWSAALAHFDAGGASGPGIDIIRSQDHLETALELFRRLGAMPHVVAAEAALGELARRTPITAQDVPGVDALRIERLVAAATTFEALAREFSAMLAADFETDSAFFVEQSDGSPLLLVRRGVDADTAADLGNLLHRRIQNGSAFDSGIQFEPLWRLEGAGPTKTVRGLWLFVGNARATAEARFAPLVKLARLCAELSYLRNAITDVAIAQRTVDFEIDAETSSELGLVCESPVMKEIANRILKIRESSVTVLVTGESGTGKEVVARAIHRSSRRNDKPFIAFNCAAVPAELAESQLFGHKKGSFTGADKDALGVIRAADGGTLFLDEIGELPLHLQPKLLRFLQEREVHPVGAERAVTVDVRVITATNRDLAREVERKTFREDLFHRLNVLNIDLPPLRERRPDLPILIRNFFRESMEQSRKRVSLSENALAALVVHDWPGNVRQLRNEIERVVALAESDAVLMPEDFNLVAQASRKTLEPRPTGEGEVIFTSSTLPSKISDAVAEIERRMISDALRRHSGNVTKTANELGISRPSLYAKCKTYGITVTKAVGSN